jgi:hypothetical protein
MRRGVAVVAVVAMLGGCSYRGSRNTAIVGAVVTAAGVGVMAAASQISTNDALIVFAVGASILPVGGSLLLGGLLGMAHYPKQSAVVAPDRKTADIDPVAQLAPTEHR